MDVTCLPGGLPLNSEDINFEYLRFCVPFPISKGLTACLYNKPMKNIEEIVFNPKLGVDADLEHMMNKNDATLLTLQVFGHWRRGFTNEEIAWFFGISPEEAESCILDVQKRISPERLRLDNETRDEILAFKNGSVEEKLGESLSKSSDQHLAEGRNPAEALRSYREAIASDESDHIADLRQRDINTMTIEGMDEPTWEKDNLLIAELRQDDKRSIKNTSKEEYSQGISQPRSPARKNETKGLSGDKSKEKTPDRRITVRMSIDLNERLSNLSDSLGLDRSFLVREAVQKYLDRPSEQPENQALPPEIFALTPPYRAWSGDRRVELRNQFEKLLALSAVSAEYFPKTRGLREIFTTLLALYQQLKINGVGHDAK